MTPSPTAIRRAAVAGMFYPGTKPELEATLKELFAQMPEPSIETHKPEGSVSALIVPHAGYKYSGPTAARAYALVRERHYDTCVLVGPSHQEYFPGVSVYPGAGYATPLGECMIDDEYRTRLLSAAPLVEASLAGHKTEHSLEVQIPFLQTVLPGTPIVPVVMGDQRPEFCRRLGHALASAASGRTVLLIASSDLSHFYPSDVARAKDAEIMRLIEGFDVEGFYAQLDADVCEACGGGPIAAVMTAARGSGARRASIVYACNSGDITGDRSRVVGYCSAAVWMPS